MLPDHNPRTRVGGFVLRRCADQLEVLLMQRFKPERGVYYVVPGGSLESGESFEQGAMRELLEETNLEFVLGEKLYESCNPQSQRIAHYYVAHHILGEPCLHADAPESALEAGFYNPTWVPLEQVSSLPLFPSIIRYRLAADLGQTALGVVRLVEAD
jgi:8-oxo-dGTP diphosphatase